MRVNGNISDLFFNTDHHFRAGDKTEAGHHDNLPEEAQDFLDCLDRLGVPVPTSQELIADFYNRL